MPEPGISYVESFERVYVSVVIRYLLGVCARRSLMLDCGPAAVEVKGAKGLQRRLIRQEFSRKIQVGPFRRK